MVIKCITEEFRNNVSKTKNQRTKIPSRKCGLMSMKGSGNDYILYLES